MTYELPFGRGRELMNKGGCIECCSRRMGSRVYANLAVGAAVHRVGFAGSPYNYLPGLPSRPNLVPGVDPVTPDWDIGPNRFPTQAQVPYLNAAAFAYPARVHGRHDGPQRGRSPRADLAAILAVEAMELLRAGATSFSDGT